MADTAVGKGLNWFPVRIFLVLYLIGARRLGNMKTYLFVCVSPSYHVLALQVSPDERISSLKRLVSEKLNVPVCQQRLLFKGKALAGECQ